MDQRSLTVQVKRKRGFDAVEHLVLCNKRRKVDEGPSAIDALGDDLADLGKAPHQRAGTRVFELVREPDRGSAAPPTQAQVPLKRKRADIDFSNPMVDYDAGTGGVVITFSERDLAKASALKDAMAAAEGGRARKRVKWSEDAPGGEAAAAAPDGDEGFVTDCYRLVPTNDVAGLGLGENGASLFGDTSVDAARVEIFDYDWDALDEHVKAIEEQQQALAGREEDDDSNDEDHPGCDYPEEDHCRLGEDSDPDDDAQQSSEDNGLYDPYQPRARSARGEEGWVCDGGLDGMLPGAAGADFPEMPDPEYGTGSRLEDLVQRMNRMEIDDDGAHFFAADPHCDYDNPFEDEEYDYGFV